MLIPSTITARRTRRYTSTWYIHPATHKRDFEPMDGRGRYIFQPPQSQAVNPSRWSILPPPFTIWTNTSVRNGKKYQYELTTPRRYYMCNGMQSMRLGCRERPHIRAERFEEPIWSEVKRVIQNPDLIVAGIDTLDAQEGGGLEEEMAQAERDLRSIQMEEDRAIRLFVSGKITEAQLDLQRRFITERLESARARLDDYRAREAGGVEKRRLMETILTWGEGGSARVWMS